MLSLSKKTDYALLALSHLTRLGESRAASTREIAAQYDLPVELLAKILQQLAKAHLVISTAGPTGGYRLARSAAEISIGSVIAVIDGPPALMQCMKAEDNGCDHHGKCTIRTPLARINARIVQLLNMTSLAEINSENADAALPILAQLGPPPKRAAADGERLALTGRG